MSDPIMSLDELSVRFMRGIRRKYGVESGIDAFNALQAVLGKEWAGRVMYDIIADNHSTGGGRIVLSYRSGAVTQKINAIKAIRGLNPHLGLKEAKDIIEDAQNGKSIMDIRISSGYEPEERIKMADAGVKELRDLGVTVEYD